MAAAFKPSPKTVKVVIATRESRLAIWQAEHVKALLEERLGWQVELLGMTTQGDQILDRSLSKVGGKGLFEIIHDIRAMDYQPKPLHSAYAGFLAAHDIDPRRAVMFDDLDKNLLVPHELGMATVHVVAGPDFAHHQVEAWELAPATGPHVHHRTDDLAGFLAGIA